MNYRHAYHAGNFADCVKHAVMALVITHLKEKPAPFRVIDTHAGIGLYDLGADEARRTGEWLGGIGRIFSSPPTGEAAAALAPYLDAVRAENEAAGQPAREAPIRYPGSPRLARALLRGNDRLIVNERHAEDVCTLKALFARDPQTSVLELDAYTALKALLPPKERRGLVLIDPPYEATDELARLVEGLKAATARFATGTVLVWMPIKDGRALRPFHQAIAAMRLPKVAVLELMVRAPSDPLALNGCGLIVINPPYTLEARLAAMMPYLCRTLATGPGASWRYGELR